MSVVEAQRTAEDPIDLAPLFARSEQLAAEYCAARPWPHVLVRGVFPEDLIDSAAAECLAIDHPDVSSSRSDRSVKDEVSSGLGPSTTQVLQCLDSIEFREFLSKVTGVDDLRDDPSHHLAGVHRTPPGGFTKVHRDFAIHPTTGYHHRLNVLVYLNRDWLPSYGGELELWEPDMSRIGKTVSPSANTMLIFETGDHSLHGHPEPLTCPPDRARVSVAAFFYTVEPGPNGPRVDKDHWVARRGEDPWLMDRFDGLRRMSPKSVKRAYHFVRRRGRPPV